MEHERGYPLKVLEVVGALAKFHVENRRETVSSLHAITKDVFSWAKRAAAAEGRESLQLRDVLCGVFALEGNEPVALALKGACGGSVPARWPEPIVKAYEAARRIDPTDKKFPLDADLRLAIRQAHAADPSLAVEHLVPALLGSSDPLIAKVRRACETGGDAAARGEALSSFGAAGTLVEHLDRLLEQTNVLMQGLKRDVLGQDRAIRMLGDAFFRARLSPTHSGPRGIFTFLGPSGVGKTLLAERFAAVLSETTGEQVACRRFDMSNFAGHDEHQHLFGSEPVYKNSRPGHLTGFVHENPRSVILLDEIEKAHQATHMSLLSVLDRGEAVDKSLERTVSFNETWIIVTTNLGANLFNSPNRAGVLSAHGVSPEFVLDVLTAKDSSKEGGGGFSDTSARRDGLPPEIVSRLAKGGIVVMDRLETRHYLRLIEHDFHSLAKQADEGAMLPELRITPEAALIFYLSLLPRVDARRVKAQSYSFAIESIKRGYEECRYVLAEKAPGRFPMEVRAAPDAVEFLERKAEERSLKLLLVDEHEHVESLLGRELSALKGGIRRASSVAEVMEALGRDRPDAVLLDISIHEERTSARVEEGGAILETIRSSAPDIPVYLFSEHSEDRQTFEQVMVRIMGRGGARGYVPCGCDLEDSLGCEDFVARVDQIVEEVRYDLMCRAQERELKSISFRPVFGWDSEKNVLACRLSGVREEVVIGSEDQTAAIRFSGVPKERLSDVMGLERAKRRLEQVVRWLKTPSALKSFGVAPPKGFLLSGPPGTGKTLLGRALAGEVGLPFLAISASEIQSRFVGESEARIRELFERAHRYAPSIIFVDEIDSIARARSGDDRGHTVSLLNQLLTCMDGFTTGERPVFVLAATNHPESLDPAILRPGRFDELIPIDLPNRKARAQFFEWRLSKLTLGPDVAIEPLVDGTAGSSPAEMDRIVREAIYAAATDGRRVISGDDLARARRLVRFGADKEDMTVDERELRLTAYHEAGHLVAHLDLLPDSPVDWVTIVPNERGALGFLATSSDESRHDVTVSEVRARMVVALCGREAERLLVGDDGLTAGAQGDLRTATRLAYAAIGKWGFDAEWGGVSVDGLPRASDGAMPPLLEQRVPAWVLQAEQDAAALLTRRRDLLERAAGLLLRYESLEGAELQRLINR